MTGSNWPITAVDERLLWGGIDLLRTFDPVRHDGPQTTHSDPSQHLEKPV